MVDRPDVEAPRGVELTGTNSRKAITLPLHRGTWDPMALMVPRRRGAWMVTDRSRSCARPLSGSRAATCRPLGGDNRRFAAAMAQVRRPVPFRTRKLRPGTAMVLHSIGCGRVARRRITRHGGPVEPEGSAGPLFACPRRGRGPGVPVPRARRHGGVVVIPAVPGPAGDPGTPPTTTTARQLMFVSLISLMGFWNIRYGVSYPVP